MTKLTQANYRVLDAAQRAYLPRLESLLSRHMSAVGVATVTATNGLPSPIADTFVFPVGDAMLETIVDVPRGVNGSNARLVTSGRMGVDVDQTRPWRSRIKPNGNVRKFDLAAGPAASSQQRTYVSSGDPVVSPRKGDMERRLEDGNLVFSVGYYLVDGKCRQFDILWVPVKDAKVALSFGKFPQRDENKSVQWSKVQKGQTILTFTKPVKYQLAKLGLNGEPLVELNSPLALPPHAANAVYDLTLAKIELASRVPLDAASGFNIYEAAYVDELLEGVTGTTWDASQVAMAAAGMMDSFVRVSPILFPEDATVTSVSVVGDRTVASLDNGKTWSVPAAAAVTLECRAYQAMDEVGLWVTPQLKPLRASCLTADDVHGMLTSLAVSDNLVSELDGRTIVYVPVGVLGTLAICDDEGKPKRFVGCHRTLWNDKLSAFVLPATNYAEQWRLGSCEFDVLEGKVADKPEKRSGGRKKFEHRMQRS